MSNITVIFILVLFALIMFMSAFDCFASNGEAIHAEFDSDISRLGDRQHEIEMTIAEMRVEMTRIADRQAAFEARINGWIGLAQWAFGIVVLLVSTLGVVIYERRKHRGQQGN